MGMARLSGMGFVAAGFALALGCSSNKTVAKVDDSGLSRLNESQMEPVDDARVEEGHAHDAVAKARANEADARARFEVARSERDVAEAQLKRSVAERDMLKKQYADRETIARAANDIDAATQRIRANDLKLEYLKKMIEVATTERSLAEAHLETASAMTEQAKYRAMRKANAPQADAVNGGSLDARVADAQLHEAQLRRVSAEKRTGAVDSYNRWQELDSKVRTLARPENIPVPPPTSGEPTR